MTARQAAAVHAGLNAGAHAAITITTWVGAALVIIAGIIIACRAWTATGQWTQRLADPKPLPGEWPPCRCAACIETELQNMLRAAE